MDVVVDAKQATSRLVQSESGGVYVDDGSGGMVGTSVFNVPNLKILIKQCDDAALLTRLGNDEKRQGVKKLVKARIAQLEAAPAGDEGSPIQDGSSCTLKVGDGPAVAFNIDNPSPEAQTELAKAVAENMADVIAAGDEPVAFDLADMLYTAEIASVKLPAVKQDGCIVDQVCTMEINIKVTPANMLQSEYFPCAFQTVSMPEIEPEGDDEEAHQGTIEGDSESITAAPAPTVLPNPGGTQRVGETDYGFNVELTSAVGESQHLLEPRAITWLAVTPDSDKQNMHPMAMLTLKLDKMPHTVGSLEKWVMGTWLLRFLPKPEEQRNDEHNTASKEKNPGQALIEDGISDADRAAHDAGVEYLLQLLTDEDWQTAIDFAGEEIDGEMSEERFAEMLPTKGAFSLEAITAKYTVEELEEKANAASSPVDRFNWKAIALTIKRNQQAADSTEEGAS